MRRPELNLNLKRKRKRDGRPVLAAQIADTWRFWALDGDQWASVDAPLAGDTLWRVAEYDALALHEGRRKAGLNRIGLEMIKSKPAIMRLGQWAAFAPADSVTLHGHAVQPIALTLMRRLPEMTAPALLRLKLPDGYTAFALYMRDKSVRGWVLSGAEDVSVTEQQILQKAGLTDAPGIDLPDVATLIAQATGVRPFPTEPEWGGLPVSVYRKAYVAVTAVVLAMAALYWIKGQAAQTAAHAHATAVDAQHAVALRTLEKWDLHHALALAKRSSLDPTALFAAARAVYLPGSQVSLTQGGKELVVELAQVSLAPIGNGRWTPRSAIEAGMAHPAPQGWRLTKLVRNGQGGYALVYKQQGGRP
ncbi:hypothetical protein [Acidihalobacter ferrooxydans]|uniref:Uncharacterized protein n=1 Tax=Acidihalobacter ferrooxydans TaxID=1765967 RepID=A0A1P8UFH8_9GAMM|nr:hypothetical protein [Acidihalobacter ferrooxydans]APZ42551.1 hypothetical protein BW247_05125 [Acidihalobacter ferrooxydans]